MKLSQRIEGVRGGHAVLGFGSSWIGWKAYLGECALGENTGKTISTRITVSTGSQGKPMIDDG